MQKAPYVHKATKSYKNSARKRKNDICTVKLGNESKKKKKENSLYKKFRQKEKYVK